MTEGGAVEQELDSLKQWLSYDFGSDSEELLPLFLALHSDRPLYLSHLPIVLHTLRAHHLEGSQLDELNAAYVYLTSSFYCVDALVDGHPQLDRNSSIELIATALPLFISAACKHLQRAVLPDSNCRSDMLISLAHESLLELRNATKSESEFCSNIERRVDFGQEAFHLAGRSATIIFLFKAVGYLANIEVDSRILNCLRSILIAIQLGDDISDWRSDFNAGKWTPFLRQCSATGARKLIDFERLILIDGQFEIALADVGKRLMTSLDYFPVDRYSPTFLKKFIESQVGKVKLEIQRAIVEKMKAGVSYEYGQK